MLRNNRFFILANASASILALVSAIVNLFVGPFNAAMWLVPVFIVGFAIITSICVQGTLQQETRPFATNWMVRAILGRAMAKRVAYRFHRLYGWSNSIASPVFLYVVPFTFVVLALVLLIFSARGGIASGG